MQAILDHATGQTASDLRHTATRCHLRLEGEGRDCLRGYGKHFKFWEAGTREPSTWELSIVEGSGPVLSGILIIAHHVGADFGDDTVSLLP